MTAFGKPAARSGYRRQRYQEACDLPSQRAGGCDRLHDGRQFPVHQPIGTQKRRSSASLSDPKAANEVLKKGILIIATVQEAPRKHHQGHESPGRYYYLAHREGADVPDRTVVTLLDGDNRIWTRWHRWGSLWNSRGKPPRTSPAYT